MHYFQFNIADYKSHTAHLTLIEDMAYRRLLDWYYLHEKPIEAQTIKISDEFESKTLFSKRMIIFLTIVCFIPIVISVIYLALLSPGYSQNLYTNEGKLFLKQGPILVSEIPIDTNVTLDKERYLWSNLDYKNNDISICRIFSDRLFRFGCYKHYPNSWESTINGNDMGWRKMAVTFFTFGLIMLLFILTGSSMVMWFFLGGLASQILIQIIASEITRNYVCYPTCYYPFITTNGFSYWIIVPQLFFALIVLGLYRYSERKLTISN